MSTRRTIIGALGAILATLVLAVANAPAQAAPVAQTAPAVESSVAAVSPGISPAAERIRYIGLFDPYSCDSGRACLAVWDPTRTQFKVFDLFRCGTYSLSFWHDQGSMRNTQTGGAIVRLYRGDGSLFGEFPPSGAGYYQFNWDPVWKVKPC
jgi:hypothetical protein